MARPSGPILPREELFRSKVRITDTCWEWTGSCYPVGYGKIWASGREEGAHRFSYRTYVAPIPHGLFVCHHCDNRRCVRPDHLFLGTCAENLADMRAKGREWRGGARDPARGERSGVAKLKAKDVEEIRVLLGEGLLQRVIASRFGVTQTTISRIARGRQWLDKRLREAPEGAH